MSNRTLSFLILAILLTVFAAGFADCASFTYASQRKEIKAGVLIFPDAGGLYTVRPAAPYVFHVLNNRMDLKPQGWEFVNPLASSRVTGEIMARWAGAGGPPYAEGDGITKEMGCYWEVKIDAGVAELSQFDVLFVALSGTYDLGRLQREKLRKLVDSGGVLWIESAPGGVGGLRNFFTCDFAFSSGGGAAWAGAPNPMHPLARRPYTLSWDEMTKLGTSASELNGSGMYLVGARTVAFSAGGDRYFQTIIGVNANTSAPVVAAAQYGSGHVVACAENVGYAISAFASTFDYGGATVRNGTYCPTERVAVAPAEDLKMAVNIASWGGEHTTFHKNARRSGFSYDEVGAPLALKWYYDGGGNIPTGSSPAILNDMVFYVDGRGVLRAFDLSPAQDVDGDGNPDDGLPDYASGAPYDRIWEANCGGPSSSATAAYVPVGGGAALPAVFVANQGGGILAFNAVTGAPLTGSNPIMTVDGYAADNPANGIIGIPAPTYFDGVVYAGDALGCLRGKNLLDNTQWKWPASPLNLPPTLTSPAVGYFRNPITGSVDQLVYMAARGRVGSVNGCVYSFPIRVFNEVLTRATGANEYRVRRYQTMAVKSDPSTFQLYISQPDGTLVEVADANVTVKQPGTFVLTTNVPSGSSVIADYEIDSSNTAYPPNYRQRIDVKNVATTGTSPPGLGVTDTPAVAPNDTLYYATENGSFYAVMEDGWGLTTKWRWYMGDPGPRSLLGGSAVAVGSAAVGNDMAYFAVNAGGTAYILAFDADPTFRISVGGPIDSRRPVEVLQYDSMNPGSEPRAVSGAAEGTDTSRRRVAFKVDYDAGRITIENFLDPLSASQDLIVRFYPPTEGSGPGTRIEQIHPAFTTTPQFDDSWNNLAWALKIDGATITSSPMLMGNILYFGTAAGRLHAVNVQRISQTTDRHAVVPVNDGIHWLWPDPDQPALGGGQPILSTVAGAHGSIVVSSAEGIAVLHNALTLVADNRRLLEMDSSGRVVWSCDSTTSFSVTRLDATATPVFGATKTPVNRPSVARRAGSSNILFADTGNNRVAMIDRAGNVLCEVSEFTDPLGVLPPGSPVRLSTPTDAWVWPVAGPVAGSTAYRFLIADSGNYRVVEVEATYDPSTGRYSRQELRWATHTLEQGKRYRYVSARRYPKPDGTGTEVICVVDNYVPESSRLETTGGAIVTIDDATGRIANSGVRRFVETPDGTQGLTRLVNPTFFSREFKAGGMFVDVIGDANGLYVTHFYNANLQTVNPGSLGHPNPRIYLARNHPEKPLVISSAQLLPSGNVLVTNRAPSLGTVRKSFAAQGEVFELVADFSKIVWPGTGVDVGKGSYPLEQPSSAERLLQ